jgi:Ca2+-transporting ATPase
MYLKDRRTRNVWGESVIYHVETVQAIAKQFSSDVSKGLGEEEARKRLAELGHNEIREKGGRTPLGIIWEQLTATMVLILLGAAAIAGALGDGKNAIAIVAIVILYVALGFVQDYRAEKAIAALKRMAVPKVRAARDGRALEVSARDLVPGDLVYLETGNVVPADVRVVESTNLGIMEAALTGESEAVDKVAGILEGEALPLGDRRNMAYMGTVVTKGRGLAMVVATGMDTELGRIAAMIQGVTQEPTPLQRRLDSLGKTLALVGVAISGLVFGLGFLVGEDIRELLLTAVSVAVAIVPEGLPAVVTITLAMGAQRMLRRQALIRKLPAVETLGSVTVICSDKTGTLTENRMTVVVMDVLERSMSLTEEVGKEGVRLSAGTLRPETPAMSLLALGGALCNDATLSEHGDGRYRALGDPTEGALVVAAANLGLWKGELEAALPRVGELAFDSVRKRMTTVHSIGSIERLDEGLRHAVGSLGAPYLSVTKGSPDGLLEVSDRVWNDGVVVPMDAAWKARITESNERLARKGMRVLAVAIRGAGSPVGEAEMERGLVFVGLFGMIDPPRAEVREAIEVTRGAGIRTVMITGDHPLTAAEIARQLGISADDRVLSGAELDRMGDEELKAAVADVHVFARVSPEHKIRIVGALQSLGHVVSMTGDGVNDAPALKQADIGVAMGITGTDVSKAASDVVLLDDNFATIVAAVKEGRTIYDNIRKFVRFSVAGNIGKVLVMLLSPLMGRQLALLPLQLLWLNLLTDGLLGLGMGVERAERDAMSRPPYSPSEGVFSRGAGFGTVWTGLLIGAAALIPGAAYFFSGSPLWQTMIFTSLAFAQIGQVMASRSTKESLFAMGAASNPLMLAMAISVICLQLGVLYLPPVAAFFSVRPLGLVDLSIVVASGLIVFAIVELSKRFARGRSESAARL